MALAETVHKWRARPLTPENCFTEGIEGPSCDAYGNLYVCNFERNGTVARVTPEGDPHLFLDLPPGSVGNGMVFDADGTMFVADHIGHIVYRIDPDAKKATVYSKEPRMNQPNDLAIMANGVLFASDPNWAQSTGNLWRIEGTGEARLLESEMGTTNGLEVSPDEKTLYVNETVQQRVWAYDLAPDGQVSNKRLFHQFSEFLLDGMRCDGAGNLYVTRYGGSRITILSPEGEPLRDVALGGKNCTNLAFGGDDGCTCFVTVADRGWVEAFRTDTPGRSWQLLEKARKRKGEG